MQGFWLFDILLALLLIGYLVYGYRIGFVRSLSAIAGVAIGGVAAFFAIPLISGWVPSPEWRVPVTLASLVLLLFAGHSAGVAVGNAIRKRVKRPPLRLADRLLGSGVTAVAAALIASTLAFSVGTLGVPLLSQSIASSTVLRTINDLTPQPVQVFMAQLRSAVIEDGLPRIAAALDGVMTEPTVPPASAPGPGLAQAAGSVVRITGNAYACGQNQSGSGFVVSQDRVVTNAHVVAGVTEPIVETPNGQSLAGRIVYFDPVDDLAIVAVSGMSAGPLPLSPTLSAGSVGAVDGYPYGGPFTSGGAEVLSVGTMNVPDIYGNSPTPREVYTLAADVNQGNSGGPFLAESGAVAGVVFAKNASTANVGYAMTMAELSPVAAQAPSLSEAVSSGACTSG